MPLDTSEPTKGQGKRMKKAIVAAVVLAVVAPPLAAQSWR